MLRFFGPGLLGAGLVAPKLTGPFSRVVDRVVTDPWLRSFIDLECFVLRCWASGYLNPSSPSRLLPAHGTSNPNRMHAFYT